MQRLQLCDSADTEVLMQRLTLLQPFPPGIPPSLVPKLDLPLTTILGQIHCLAPNREAMMAMAGRCSQSRARHGSSRTLYPVLPTQHPSHSAEDGVLGGVVGVLFARNLQQGRDGLQRHTPIVLLSKDLSATGSKPGVVRLLQPLEFRKSADSIARWTATNIGPLPVNCCFLEFCRWLYWG
jgi:hypothetical protein